MFCLKISAMSVLDFQQAMFIMSYHHVSMTAYSNGEDAASTYMVVGGEGCGQQVNEEALYNAEMAFMMNFRQEGMKCLHCAVDKMNGEQTCGHLTFTTFIDSSAFDRALGVKRTLDDIIHDLDKVVDDKARANKKMEELIDEI